MWPKMLCTPKAPQQPHGPSPSQKRSLSPPWIFSKKKEEGRKKRGSHSVTGKENIYILNAYNYNNNNKKQGAKQESKEGFGSEPFIFSHKEAPGPEDALCPLPTPRAQHSPSAAPAAWALPRTAPVLHGTQRPQPMPSPR